MAKSKSTNKDGAAEGGGTADFVKSVVLAVVIGLGGGGAFGYFSGIGEPATPAKAAAEASVPDAPSGGRFPNDALEVQVPAVIVQLKGEPKTNVRLDFSIIAAHGTTESGALKSEIREDVIGYLEGLSIADIEGVRGFQNLREQLDDRAKIRGRGAVLGLLIGGLILE